MTVQGRGIETVGKALGFQRIGERQEGVVGHVKPIPACVSCCAK
jgi:hypothetical protein